MRIIDWSSDVCSSDLTSSSCWQSGTGSKPRSPSAAPPTPPSAEDRMDFTLLVFLAFAVVTVVAAGAVISVRSPVYAALCLVLTFFTVACTWILADAEFLGIALVVVYVGAVMVLFMFVVMMLDIDEVKMHEGYVRYLPLGLLVAVVMLAEILVLIGIKARATPFDADPALAAGVPNIEWLAGRLFTGFLLPFEVEIGRASGRERGCQSV